MPEQTLNERLTAAQREADALREQLCDAEFKQNAAVTAQDFAAAEEHKRRADAAREPLLIAEAHVRALTEGVQALDAHRMAEQQAEQLRQQREAAKAQYETFTAEEAEAVEQVQRYLAEVGAGYAAIRQAMTEAVAAEDRVDQARAKKWQAGVLAALLPEDYPRPRRSHMASTRFDNSQMLSLIQRTPNPS